MIQIKRAPYLVALWMRLSGFRGLTTPWAIYLARSSMNDARLIRHEQRHVEQIRRDGVLRFYARYLWWSVKYGYQENPYEVEAHAAEDADA